MKGQFFVLVLFSIIYNALHLQAYHVKNPLEDTKYVQDLLFKRSINKIVAVRGEQQACTYAINKIRASFGLSPLVWNQHLANEAEKWAIHQAGINEMVDSSSPYDENNYYTGYYQHRVGEYLKCAGAIYTWYMENFQGGERGHLLNMLQQGGSFGMGMAYSNKKIFSVAYFNGRNQNTASAFQWRQDTHLQRSDLESNLGHLQYISLCKKNNEFKKC